MNSTQAKEFKPYPKRELFERAHQQMVRPVELAKNEANK